MPAKAFQASITGEVQWVGFRAFARSQAFQLGLTGYVRNRPDGRVEVVAEGEESALETFLEKLHRGPASARVENVAVTWSTPKGKWVDFRITY
jgi:acylphosphatase